MADAVVLKRVDVPVIGLPAEPRPELMAPVFEARLARVRARMRERGLDALVVYGDREHVGAIQWLTNYDPRFEETLLVVLPAGTPVLFVGNEGMGYSTIARLPVERRLCQTLSLLGQPRDRLRPLAAQLREAGIAPGSRVGAAGWKYFSAAEFGEPDGVLDWPEFLAASLRSAAGPAGRVTNETALFMDPENGLRVLQEAEQLADFEWIATANSQALLDGIRAIRPGMTEHAGFEGMRCNGLALGCHPICSAGDRARRHGMASPTSHTIGLGDPVMMTMSYQGANTCRFGWMAASAQDLPAETRDYIERTAAPYVRALFAWYETMRLGATGDALHRAVHGILDPAGVSVSLNAGHLTAMDEWTHSLVEAGSGRTVRSGMYWQADFFGTVPTAHHGAFAEDGLVVADEALRADLKKRFPAMWGRIESRRRFMQDALGVRLAPEVLPLSNFPAMLVPFFMEPGMTLVRAGRA
jgi:Xaa-Pro aminopeptidase